MTRPRETRTVGTIAGDRAYRESHRADANARSRAWAKANRARRRRTERKYRKANRKRIAIVKAAWKVINRLKVNATNRLYKLNAKLRGSGLTYDELLARQNGVCAICGSSHPRRKQSTRFCVDHDHETGQVRGLLCGPCNTMIGLAREDIDVLNNAIIYLVPA